jgi:hypothetical protein
MKGLRSLAKPVHVLLGLLLYFSDYFMADSIPSALAAMHA